MRKISPTSLATLVVLALGTPLASAQSSTAAPAPRPVTNAAPATQAPPVPTDSAAQSPNARNQAAQKPNAVAPGANVTDPAAQSPNARNQAAQNPNAVAPGTNSNDPATQSPNARNQAAQNPDLVVPGATITGDGATVMPGANGGVVVVPGPQGVDIQDPVSGNGVYVPPGTGVVIIEGVGQAPSQPARTPTPELDKAVRKELQRRANRPATNEQRLNMIVPRTEADRTDQMRDDPIRPGVTAPVDTTSNKTSTK